MFVIKTVNAHIYWIFNTMILWHSIFYLKIRRERKWYRKVEILVPFCRDYISATIEFITYLGQPQKYTIK